MVLRNDQTIQQLKSEFQATDDASFAHESLVSSYQSLPGLRVFYPMSGISDGASLIDMAGNSKHMTHLNIPLVLGWPVPAMFFQTASSQAFYYLTEGSFDIQGNESYVHSSYQGLTIGAWVYFDAIGQTNGFIGKWSTAAGNQSYILHLNAADEFIFYITNDGTNAFSVTHTTTPVVDKWYFVVGRFDPSTEVKIWVNDVAVVNTTSIPATIFDGNASFTVGAYGTGPATFGGYMEGKMSMAFLCAAYLPDRTVRRLYYRTRPAFQSRQDW